MSLEGQNHAQLRTTALETLLRNSPNEEMFTYYSEFPSLSLLLNSGKIKFNALFKNTCLACYYS